MTFKHIKLVVLIFLVILPSANVYAVDILKQTHPYVSVRGEYSDNLDLTYENEKDDFYTTVSPGIRFSNMDDRSGVDLDASVGYVFYSQYDDRNYLSANASLDAKYLTGSHFNFYLRDTCIRSDDPREREFFTTAADNRFVLATERQRAVYWRNVVEPTVEYQFGPENLIGVKYRNNYYRAEDIENNDSIENFVSPFLTYWFNQQHGISLDYAYTNGYFEADPDLNGHRVSGAYMYRFSPKATGSLKGAYTKQAYSEDLMDYEIYETSLGITYLFSPTLTASAEVGYYWQNPEVGNTDDGVTFNVNITQRTPRTTYILSLQGGYIVDQFTSENLGFRKYYRATGSITHFLDRQLSIGCLGSVERSEEPETRSVSDPGLEETIWRAGANVTYLPFQWLNISLGYNYVQNDTNAFYELTDAYTENRVMLSVTATY